MCGVFWAYILLESINLASVARLISRRQTIINSRPPGTNAIQARTALSLDNSSNFINYFRPRLEHSLVSDEIATGAL